MSYKIVFQGGGAKLFPLIAAVEAIQKQVEDNEDFSVSAVAGASAGAIASMILAAGVDCDALKKHFKTVTGKKAVLSAFPSPNRLSVIQCVAFGKTLFDRAQLEELLYKILELGGHTEKKATIRLQSKLIIAITDLKKSEVEFVEMEEASAENIVKNVADSCSIPFVFKNHRSKYNWEYVDGGLFENFPVSAMASSVDATRRVLGFSFSDEARGGHDDDEGKNRKNPTLLSYLKVLVSTAIDANISASLRLLGEENVFTIQTEISTLDFKYGLEQFVEQKNRLDSIKQNIEAWIEGIVRRENQIDASISYSDSAIVPTDFLAYCQFAAKHFESRKNESLRIIESVSYFQINSIYGDTSPNKSKFEYLYRKYTIEVPDEGVECILFGTSYESTIDVEKYSDFIAVDDNGISLGPILFPLAGSAYPEDYVALAAFFGRRVLKSDSKHITVIMKQFIPDILEPLTEKGVGHLIVGSPPNTVTEKLLLFVGMPQEYAHLYHVEPLKDCREVAEEDLKALPATNISDTSVVDEIKSGGTQVTGFECAGPIPYGEALALRVQKASGATG